MSSVTTSLRMWLKFCLKSSSILDFLPCCIIRLKYIQTFVRKSTKRNHLLKCFCLRFGMLIAILCLIRGSSNSLNQISNILKLISRKSNLGWTLVSKIIRIVPNSATSFQFSMTITQVINKINFYKVLTKEL